jgi:hypothetical protein
LSLLIAREKTGAQETIIAPAGDHARRAELLARFDLYVQRAVGVSEELGRIDQRGFPPFGRLLHQSSTCLRDFPIGKRLDELNVRFQHNFGRPREQLHVLVNDPSDFG